MTIEFVTLSTTVATDDDVSSWVTEAKMTVHYRISKSVHDMCINSLQNIFLKQMLERIQYEINGKFSYK